MVKPSYLMNKIKDVKLADYLSVFPMIVAILLKTFYRNKYEGTWLVCEEPAEARDNGYHFFKYMCQKQPQQRCFYAIKENSVDAIKVKKLGETIAYGSIQHWLAYFLCDYNISSQKGGKPNAAICSFMELSGIFKPHNIFLQHGVIINDVRWLYADRSRFEKFITSTIPETRFVEEKLGYSEDVVSLTGLPRFDALHDITVDKKQILIMPTWRYWFNLNSKKDNNVNSNFKESKYLEKWEELLNSEELARFIEKNNLKVVFYLHRNLQSHINSFKNINKRIVLASWKKYDIQYLLKNSAMMITDYSSVFFDMIYMKKPIIFYQFDEEEYRKYQYGEGYFDYHNNPFGKTFRNAEDVVASLKEIVMSDFEMSKKYLAEHSIIFKYYDQNNSRRIYELLSEG